MYDYKIIIMKRRTNSNEEETFHQSLVLSEQDDQFEQDCRDIEKDLIKLQKYIHEIKKLTQQVGSNSDGFKTRKALYNTREDALVFSKSLHEKLTLLGRPASLSQSMYASSTTASRDKDHHIIYKKKLSSEYRALLTQLQLTERQSKETETRHKLSKIVTEKDNNDGLGNNCVDSNSISDDEPLVKSLVLVKATGTEKLKKDQEITELLIEDENAESLENIEKEVAELSTIFNELNQLVLSNDMIIAEAHNNIAQAEAHVAHGMKELKTASSYAMYGLTLAGATIGGFVGGPLGVLAGAKTVAGVGAFVGVGLGLGAIGAWGSRKFLRKSNDEAITQLIEQAPLKK